MESTGETSIKYPVSVARHWTEGRWSSLTKLRSNFDKSTLDVLKEIIIIYWSLDLDYDRKASINYDSNNLNTLDEKIQ